MLTLGCERAYPGLKSQAARALTRFSCVSSVLAPLGVNTSWYRGSPVLPAAFACPSWQPPGTPHEGRPLLSSGRDPLRASECMLEPRVQPNPAARGAEGPCESEQFLGQLLRLRVTAPWEGWQPRAARQLPLGCNGGTVDWAPLLPGKQRAGARSMSSVWHRNESSGCSAASTGAFISARALKADLPGWGEAGWEPRHASVCICVWRELGCVLVVCVCNSEGDSGCVLVLCV